MACVNLITVVNLWKVNAWLKTKKIGVIKILRLRIVKVKNKKRFRSRSFKKFEVKWIGIKDKKS